MKPFPLSPPAIASPLYHGGKAVTVGGCQAGALVKIYRLPASLAPWSSVPWPWANVIGQGIYPEGDYLLNIGVDTLNYHDFIWATQEYQAGTLSLSSPGPGNQSPPPQVEATPRPLPG